MNLGTADNKLKTPIDIALILIYAPLTFGIPFIVEYWFYMLKELISYDENQAKLVD